MPALHRSDASRICDIRQAPQYLFSSAQALRRSDDRSIPWQVLKPCRIHLKEKTKGYIQLTEGKYHEIKRMFGAVGNKITFLERVNFGPLKLDETLQRGEWRELTEAEQKQILNY